MAKIPVRTVHVRLDKRSYAALSELSARCGFAYPAQLARALIGLLADGCAAADSGVPDDTGLARMFGDFADWQRSPERVFAPSFRRRE